MKLLTYVLDLLFPPRCVFCQRFLDSGSERVCERCGRDLPYTKPGDKQKFSFVKACVSPLEYKDDVRESLLRFKFRGARGYAKTYAPYVADCIRRELNGQWDVLSWVPISRKRLRERGYDQSELLALAVAEALGIEAQPTLIKKRHTKAQSSTGSAEKRRANIAGAYKVKKDVDVSGKRILLLDDIVTTGSTLSECARTLGMAGADQVVCATVARARD